jgi:predicted N-acetyltransferase YhbS
VIRPERPGDVDAIDAVVAAAFRQRDEADLVRALRSDPSWRASLCLVAAEGDRIVGHLALTRATVDGTPVLALAPLAVHPEHQRRGWGAALVTDGLRRAADLAETTVVVLGDPAYYGRFGFRPARELGISGPFGDIDEFQALALAEVSPTGQMTYPAPFGIDLASSA